MFSMPKIEMVEFEVESIMTASPAEPTSSSTTQLTGPEDPDQGDWD